MESSESVSFGINASATGDLESREWRVIEIRTSMHAPTHGRSYLVLCEGATEGREIVKRALADDVIFIQGVEAVERGTDRGELKYREYDNVLEWLCDTASPNTALWADTDPKGQDVNRIMTRGVARHLRNS